MTEEFSIKGEWFLPSNNEQRVHGILTYHPQNGADLELYGSLNGDSVFQDFIDHEIILGLTSDSKQVTLYFCDMTESEVAILGQAEESGKPSTKYSIRYTLMGLHVDSINNLKFDVISSEIFNLGEWVGISGFNRQNHDIDKFKKHEIIVEYKLPEHIEFVIDNDAKGLFKFIAKSPRLSRYQKTITITQRVEFQVKLKKEKSIEEL